jgi:2,3-bisphosphoglycerate-dependent phosphoglycerate mutase/probable phosphoglycerate mutase
MRTSVYLLRHGQTEANLQRRYQSWSDGPLTAFGTRQMAATALRLRRIPFTAAVSSPSGRARASLAPLLAERAGLAPHKDAGWAEASHGRWEGLTYREVLARFPDEVRARFADGEHGKAAGGESLHEAAERVAGAWGVLLREHEGGRVLVLTHATPIQLVLCAAFGIAPGQHWHWRIDLGSITCLDVYPSGAIVRVVNEVPLLSRKG